MECKICKNQAKHVKTLRIRQKYDAHYYRCDYCDFMFVADPSWLKEAYEKPINTTDTGYMARNIYLSRKTLILFVLIFEKNNTFLDYAGGYGVLSRLMRDYGLEFFTDDPYTPNLFAQGFDYVNQKIKALTCFECFEHLSSPLEDIEKMLSISSNIFISTMILPKNLPGDDWEYFGRDHGQHVSFFSKRTFEYIAGKYELNFYTDGENLHLLTQKKLPRFVIRIVNIMTKLQLDLFFRKLLKSKTYTDRKYLLDKKTK